MIGTLLKERYQLDSELGQGGLGTIYQAYDRLLNRPVAVKVLSDVTLSSENRARLLREAQTAAQLNHPNIVSVHDAGEDEGIAFIVMELVEGESLYSQRPEDLGEILAIARQVCIALEHAHAHDIIHRDLKPENVLITVEGVVKLTDFGLAHTLTSRSSTEGAIIGTVLYFAPEQALGEEVDCRADLYSLGVMLYELVAGRLPFRGENMAAVISQHLHAPVVAPGTYNDAIPKDLEKLILQLLQKKPQERPATAGEVRKALENLSRADSLEIPISSIPNNLPAQATPFIGRQQQLEAVRGYLIRPEVRLLTLTGTGGTGKTRLGVQVAANLMGEFKDGVFFIPLASVSDPELVIPAIAHTLGIRKSEEKPLFSSLVDYLREKRTLLVLDNFEQVTGAAPFVSELLSAASLVKVLVISRALLRLQGEHHYSVPTLTLPDPGNSVPLERDLESEAVQLFIQRAQAVKSDFTITEANRHAVKEICRRLDGLPLAIELAAARVRLLPPRTILAQLDNRFKLLTGGARDAPARHQTLQGAMEWSYDLLAADEMKLFQRLSVFCCSFSLEDARAVCSELGAPSQDQGRTLDVIAGLEALADQSLIQPYQDSADARFGMLETIRDYAAQRLVESGEYDAVQRQNARYFVALAEKTEPMLVGKEQLFWLNRLKADSDHLRAALRWSLAREGEDLELGLRLASSLSYFWNMAGRITEAVKWLDIALEKSSAASREVRAKVLLMAGFWVEDFKRGRSLFQESLEVYQQLGDKQGLARTLLGLAEKTDDLDQANALAQKSFDLFSEIGDPWGISSALLSLGYYAFTRQDYPLSQDFYQRSLDMAREAGDRWRIANILRNYGMVKVAQQDYEGAALLYNESLALSRELDEKKAIAYQLNSLGEVARLQDDYQQAEARYSESLEMCKELGDRSGVAMITHNLGHVALYGGNSDQAAAYFRECLSLYKELNMKRGIAISMAGLAGVAGAKEQPQRAAWLFGAAQALLDATSAQIDAPADKAEYDHNLKLARSQIDPEDFARAWGEGRQAAEENLEHTIAKALEGI